MADRIIELRWKCAECGATNRGRDKDCKTGCGSTRDKGETLSAEGADDRDARGYNPAATVTDPELLGLANAGTDWFCSRCGSGNRGDGSKCVRCDAPREGKPEEDLTSARAAQARRDRLNAYSAASRREAVDSLRKVGGTLGSSVADLPRPSRTYDPGPAAAKAVGVAAVAAWVPTFLAVAAAVLAAVCCAGFVVWALQTHDVRGSVTAMSWKHTTIVQRWTDVTVREWRHKSVERSEIPPTGGRGERSGNEMVFGSCRDEHWDDEKYQCGTEPKCEPKYKRVPDGEDCRSTDNGFAKCTTKYKSVRDGETCRDVPKYCKRPIYKARCDYRRQVWRPLRSKDESGSGLDTRWPQLEVGLRDRLRHTAAYDVTVAYTDGGDRLSHTFDPAPGTAILAGLFEMETQEAIAAEAQYKAWRVGEDVVLKVNNLGGVSEVLHANQAVPR